MSNSDSPQKRHYRKAEDCIGLKFNRLTVLRIVDRTARRNGARVECSCECGGSHIVAFESVKSGEARSCGCLKSEKLALPTSQRTKSAGARKRKNCGQTPEARRASKAKWRKLNPEKARACTERFYQRHPGGKAAHAAAFFQRHKAEIIAARRERRAVDPIYRLSHTLRSRIRRTIKIQGAFKRSKCFELLGCTLDECRAHIESLFTEGMSWELFMKGEIHLDHVRPIRAFNLSDPDQQALAFNFRNLQPLWALDNLSKSDKLPDGTRARMTPITL